MLCIFYYDDIPNTHVSYKQLQTIGGHMKNIKQKSENAKLTISRLDGVRRFFVHVNMYTTSPLPTTASTPKKKIVTPNHLYHSDSIGGNWYLWKHRIALNDQKYAADAIRLPSGIDHVHHVCRHSVDHRFIAETSVGHAAPDHFLPFVTRSDFIEHFRTARRKW